MKWVDDLPNPIRHTIVSMSIRRLYIRLIDVEMTSCVYWDSLLSNIKLFINFQTFSSSVTSLMNKNFSNSSKLAYN